MEHGRMDSMASVASLAPTGLGNKDSLANSKESPTSYSRTVVPYLKF